MHKLKGSTEFHSGYCIAFCSPFSVRSSSFLLKRNCKNRRALIEPQRHCAITMTAANDEQVTSLLRFYHLIGRLKTTKRTGWVNSGVKLPESIADHMYRMSLMALVTSDANVNASHAMRLALVHDLAESLVGDITPYDGINKTEKYKLERDAMLHIQNDILCGNEMGHELFQLWVEYEDGKTKEAQFVKQLDKLEMLVQADEYEKEQDIDLSGFFTSTKGVFSTPLLKSIDARIRNERVATQAQSAGAASDFSTETGADVDAGADPGADAGADAVADVDAAGAGSA